MSSEDLLRQAALLATQDAQANFLQLTLAESMAAIQNDHWIGLADQTRAAALQQLVLSEPDNHARSQQYIAFIRDVFLHVGARWQNSLILALPDLADSPRSAALVGELLPYLILFYTNMLIRLVSAEDGNTLAARLVLVKTHGRELLQYITQILGHNVTVLMMLYKMMSDRLPASAVDSLTAWFITTTTQSSVFASAPADKQRIQLWQFYQFLNTQSQGGPAPGQYPATAAFLRLGQTTSVFPGEYPETAALLRPAYEEQEQIWTATHVHALTQRLRARRRLSIPLYLDGSFAGIEAGEEVALHVLPRIGARKRRPTTVTPTSSTTDIQRFLETQGRQDERLVTLLGGAWPNPFRASRRRARVSTASASATAASRAPPTQPPPTDNCQRFAQRCDAKSQTNLEGKDWCRVPEVFWWGPLAPGNQCYDVRDILRHNARQVIAIPGLRGAHPPTYPDRRPLSDNYLRTFAEIAKRNNYPVPTEIEMYLAGRQLQSAPPATLFPPRSEARQRLTEQAPYLGIAAFANRQAANVLLETEASMGLE